MISCLKSTNSYSPCEQRVNSLKHERELQHSLLGGDIVQQPATDLITPDVMDLVALVRLKSLRSIWCQIHPGLLTGGWR